MAKILINDLVSLRQKSGVGAYCELLVKNLMALNQHEICPMSQSKAAAPLHMGRQLYQRLRNHEQREETLGRGPSKLGRFTRESLPNLLNHYLKTAFYFQKYSLYHDTDVSGLNADGINLLTVHDVTPLLFADWHPRHRVARYEKQLHSQLRNTAHVIADSTCTKNDLHRLTGFSNEKITVIPLAPRPKFRVVKKEEVGKAITRLSLPKKYFLYLGTIEPRKNIRGLLLAYAGLPEKIRRQYSLVLVGGWGWKSEAIATLLSKNPWSEQVRYVGYLNEEDCVLVTNGATALVYPSFYEGFGLPPLEAMACGTPVITSHEGSLKETVGDAGMIVDPREEASLTAALERMVSDPELQRNLVERVFESVKKFDWKNTARNTLAVYESLLN